jgi:oligopeptidase B
MRARIKEADKSVPQKDGDFLYWIEFEEGAEYKKWWRRPVAPAAAGRADPRRGGAGRGQGILPPRRDSRSATTASCWPGRSTTTARNASPRGSSDRDRRSAARRDPGTLSGAGLGRERQGPRLFARQRAVAHRQCPLHWLGQPVDEDVELYHEDDEGFRVGSSLSANEKWLIISHRRPRDQRSAADPGRRSAGRAAAGQAAAEGRRIRRR